MQGCYTRQLDDKRRVPGACHFRIFEGLGVNFPRAARRNEKNDANSFLPGRFQFLPWI